MPKGSKTCPQCGKSVGPRSHFCPNCSYDFGIAKKVKEVKQPIQTIRPKTESEIKANVDLINSKRRPKINNGRSGVVLEDWKSLEKDDVIRVLQGSGPYWPGKNEDVPMGYHGLFKVRRVSHDGILAYPAENRHGEASFIYMGEEKLSKIGTMMRPHKIKKVNPKYIKSGV